MNTKQQQVRILMTIPKDIVDWFRDIFSASNRRISERIQNSPNILEQHLDLTFIDHLLEYQRHMYSSQDG